MCCLLPTILSKFILVISPFPPTFIPISLFLFLSLIFSPSLSPPVCLSVCLSVCLFLCLLLPASLSHFVSFSVYLLLLSLCLSLSLSCLSSLSISPSLSFFSPISTFVFQIRVRAQDGGSPRLSDITRVEITVQRNLFPPVFNPLSYIATIPETQVVGSAVGIRVQATDADTTVSMIDDW